MIELKNVSKTYKSKKASDTVALKDISIKFPEKGLVFILGKSGSGKSTLLNVIGGLDKYDDGEVIINGKSTKQFKEKDFDAFRNTYMGFVFQEYNLLENYSIEQNIKLPLELQHKKVTEKEVSNALKQVDLEDISKRKTNELSGGQKQRVAIARALVKNPEIILADEPTGNLDTETSKQIWNILKDLSKDKLVIVVSHDSESALKYADRIIRIQDGTIISDEGNTNVTNTKEFKLVKAKLPFFYSFKMAVSNLLHKKIRLVFSSILIIFSLICFGIMLSAYTSDLNAKTLELFEENSNTDVTISKYKIKMNYLEAIKEQMQSIQNYNEEYEYEMMEKYEPIDVDDNFRKDVEEKTNLSWQPVYTIDSPNGDTQMVYPDSLQNEDNMPIYYYIGNYGMSFTFMESDNLEIDNIIGTKPQKDDEILISSYVADCIIYHGCMAKDTNNEKIESKEYKPKDYNELISSGKYINISNIAYLKVVGIIDNSDRLNEFNNMKQIKVSEYFYDDIGDDTGANYQKLLNEISNNESVLYVNSSFITKMKEVKNTYSARRTKIEYNNQTYIGQMIAYVDKELEICTDSGIKKVSNLNDNEIIINEGTLDLITEYDFSNSYENNRNKYDSKQEFLIKYLKDNSIIGKTLKTNVNNGTLVNEKQDYSEYKIIGVYIDETTEEYGVDSTIYYSQKIIEPLIIGNVHCKSVTRKVNNLDEMKKILSIYPVDSSNELSSSVYSETALEAATISYLLQFVSKYGVVFFLVFSAIILMNYINSSIKFRKKEIGTLRALGCRSIDIIKMFLYESIIIMLICLGISFAIIPNVINTINEFIIEGLLMNINILSFGIKQILEITGIMFIIVILANVIPVRRITKMKPIDAILNK